MAYVTIKDVLTKGGKTKKRYLAKWKQDGKTREKAFDMKREANSFAAEMKQLHEGSPLTPMDKRQLGDRALRDLAADFIEELREEKVNRDARENITVRGYESLLNIHILDHLEFKGGATAQSVGYSHFEYLTDVMYRKGASFDRIKRCVVLLKQLLRYAIRKNIRTAAIPDFSLEKPASVAAQEVENAEKVYTPDQIYTLLRAADALADAPSLGTRQAWVTYRPMLYFLVDTGARISEARAFAPDGYDGSGKVIRIRQAASEEGVIKLTKSRHGRRDLPLTPMLKEVLDSYIATQKGDLAFGSRAGTPRGIPNLHRRMLAPLIGRANAMAKESDDPRMVPVENFGFHAIRHAYASRLIQANANMKQLQKYMGHHDPAFTMRIYGHLFPDTADAVIAGMVI